MWGNRIAPLKDKGRESVLQTMKSEDRDEKPVNKSISKGKHTDLCQMLAFKAKSSPGGKPVSWCDGCFQ